MIHRLIRRFGTLPVAGYITLGPSGLTMNGGNGIDGETVLAWLDPIEMGGTLLLELVGVTLSPGSNGILGGFFNGYQTASGCTAGFQATAQQGTGSRDVAADGRRHAGGNHLCRESRQHLHTAHAHSLPGKLPRGSDVLLLRG